MKKTAMVKFAKARLLLKLMKKGFVPMPGGMPTDPAMAGGAMPPAGGAPMPAMDPAMMGAYASPPMGGDPMGGMPPVDPATGMPMDPAMMGGDPAAMGGGGEMPMEPTIAELPISMFQELMAETITQILSGGVEEGGEGDPVEPSSEGPTNTELMERMSAMEEMLAQLAGGGGGGGGGMAPGGEAPPMMGGVGPGGGGMMGAGMPQGLEVSAGARPKPGLADRLVDSALIAANTEK